MTAPGAWMQDWTSAYSMSNGYRTSYATHCPFPLTQDDVEDTGSSM